MMDPKTAHLLYQLNQHIEKTRFTSHLLNVQINQISKNSIQPLSLGWDWIFTSLKIKAPGGNLLKDTQESKEFSSADAYTLADYFTFEMENSHSISGRWRSAQEIAGQVKKQLSHSIILHLDHIGSWLRNSKITDIWPHQTSNFYNQVQESIYLFYGLSEYSLYRGENFNFLQLGRFSEHLKNLSALLKTYIKYIVEWKDMEKELISVLLYCGAFNFYQQQVDPKTDLSKVFTFLINDPKAPCSVYFLIEQLEQAIADMGSNNTTAVSKKSSSSILSLKNWISQKRKESLESFIESIYEQSCQIQNDIVEDYF